MVTAIKGTKYVSEALIEEELVVIRRSRADEVARVTSIFERIEKSPHTLRILGCVYVLYVVAIVSLIVYVNVSRDTCPAEIDPGRVTY